MKRLLAILVGFALIALVVWLGIRTGSDTSLVPWFGIAAALLAPLGLSFIGYALTSREKAALAQLTTIPEINRLIAQAKSEEERIRLLQEQQRQLDELVRFEAERRTLETRRDLLEKEAARILAELRMLDQQIVDLGLKVSATDLGEQFEQLQERIKRLQAGDIVLRFGHQQFFVPRSIFQYVPFGELHLEILRQLSLIQRKFRRAEHRKRLNNQRAPQPVLIDETQPTERVGSSIRPHLTEDGGTEALN
jgi:hypothetical protein